jgi:hypothetical protein
MEFEAKNNKKEIVELDCSNKHIFHKECLKQWISNPKNDNCPLCRE